jgi:CDP-diacylglycerol--serine O-phosphatidyltransferase
LARFNTQLGTEDKRFFQGLPCPAAAAVVAGLVWFATDYGWSGKDLAAASVAVTLFTRLLMVSNVRVYSFKELDLRGRVPFVALLAVLLVFVLISTDPPLVLFLVFLMYAVSGPLVTLVHIRKRRMERRNNVAGQSPPSDDEST